MVFHQFVKPKMGAHEKKLRISVDKSRFICKNIARFIENIQAGEIHTEERIHECNYTLSGQF
jgi:hypothetical protein